MKRPLASLTFLFALACNSPGGIGSPCTVNADCELGQLCNTTAPGGFCTKGCSFEGAKLQECPAGSICTSFAASTQVCATTCTSASQCRDQYECNGTAGSTVKACKPKS